MGFADDVKKFQAKALKDMNDSVAKVVTTMFKDIVALTPSPSMNASNENKAVYSRGLLVNQWYPAIKVFDRTTGNAIDDVGAGSYMRIYSILSTQPFYGKDNTITLTNSVSYIMKAERLGWDRTGPYAMVATSLVNIKQAYS